MTGLEVIILGLATWRLASLLANEAGPGEIFQWLRTLGGEWTDADGTRQATTWWGKGLICLWCCSVWSGVFFVFMYLITPYWWWLAGPLALSTVAIGIDQTVNR